MAVHGNPLHPQKEIAESYDTDFKNAVLPSDREMYEKIKKINKLK